MYELVKRILDKSKETGEDVLVARDMCIAEDKENIEKLKDASAVIKKYYSTITKLRRLKDAETIEKLCLSVVADDKAAINSIVEEVKNRVE